MKDFDAYIKVIESYGGKTSIHSGPFKTKLSRMWLQDNNNPTQEENENSEEEFKGGYL